MCLPFGKGGDVTTKMLDSFNKEIANLQFNGVPISSFDIWLGLSYQDKLKGILKGEEYKYMTHAYSTLVDKLFEKQKSLLSDPSSPSELIKLKDYLREYVQINSANFLMQEDKNVQRVIRTDLPISYNQTLLSPEAVTTQEHLKASVDECINNLLSVIIPIPSLIESRWKAVVWIRLEGQSDISSMKFVQCNQQLLLEFASHLYTFWQVSLGKDYNLYRFRGVFCENAISIAQYLVEGDNAKSISKKLNITHSGVEYHINTMKTALAANNRAHLVAELIRKEIVC